MNEGQEGLSVYLAEPILLADTAQCIPFVSDLAYIIFVVFAKRFFFKSLYLKHVRYKFIFITFCNYEWSVWYKDYAWACIVLTTGRCSFSISFFC